MAFLPDRILSRYSIGEAIGSDAVVPEGAGVCPCGAYARDVADLRPPSRLRHDVIVMVKPREG
jgi:hypothetical protein